MSAETRYVNARVPRNEDARLLTGRARFVDDVQLPGMLHVAFVRSDHAHARLIEVDASAARQRRGVAAVYTFADLGDYGTPAPLLVPPPPIPGLVFHPCTHRPLAKDKVRYVGEPIAMIVAESRYVAEDAVRDVVVDVEPLDAVVDLEAALAPGAPRVHEHLASNAAAHVVQRKGDYAAARAQADAIDQPPLSLRPRRRGGDREPLRRGRMESAGRRADHLGHDAGADPDSQRPGRAARPARVAGARRRAVRRRRIRAEDHDVLPGGAARAVGIDAAGAAGQVDRGPAGELLRDHAGARPGARRGDGADARRADPRRARLVPVRHRRLRSLRADHSDQHAVHAARPVRHSELRQRVHGGLHQQDDRHAGARRRPPARRVRERAAARHRGARARDRSRRDPEAQPAGARPVPAQPRDHVPGLRAARLRQRRLPAGARAGRRDDWLRRARARADAPPRAGRGGSASASRATWRARASARTRARA